MVAATDLQQIIPGSVPDFPNNSLFARRPSLAGLDAQRRLAKALSEQDDGFPILRCALSKNVSRTKQLKTLAESNFESVAAFASRREELTSFFDDATALIATSSVTTQKAQRKAREISQRIRDVFQFDPPEVADCDVLRIDNIRGKSPLALLSDCEEHWTAARLHLYSQFAKSLAIAQTGLLFGQVDFESDDATAKYSYTRLETDEELVRVRATGKKRKRNNTTAELTHSLHFEESHLIDARLVPVDAMTDEEILAIPDDVADLLVNLPDSLRRACAVLDGVEIAHCDYALSVKEQYEARYDPDPALVMFGCVVVCAW